MNKHILALALLGFALFAASGCSSLPFVAPPNPTDLPTRTPRPTFTPRIPATSTQSDTSTPTSTSTATVAETDTPEATVTSMPPPTVKPVSYVTKVPPPPTVTPVPPPTAFPAHLTHDVRCPSSDTYLVIASLRQDSTPHNFVAGFTMALFDTGGNLLKDGAGHPLAAVTPPQGQQGTQFYSNCEISGGQKNPIFYSNKIDVIDAVRAGTTHMIFRFVKSVQDLTPLSSDYGNIDFSAPGEYWLNYGTP